MPPIASTPQQVNSVPEHLDGSPKREYLPLFFNRPGQVGDVIEGASQSGDSSGPKPPSPTGVHGPVRAESGANGQRGRRSRCAFSKFQAWVPWRNF